MLETIIESNPKIKTTMDEYKRANPSGSPAPKQPTEQVAYNEIAPELTPAGF